MSHIRATKSSYTRYSTADVLKAMAMYCKYVSFFCPEEAAANLAKRENETKASTDTNWNEYEQWSDGLFKPKPGLKEETKSISASVTDIPPSVNNAVPLVTRNSEAEETGEPEADMEESESLNETNDTPPEENAVPTVTRNTGFYRPAMQEQNIKPREELSAAEKYRRFMTKGRSKVYH